ncbi:hypothetical protein M413DRAFT_25800 [Hebeloma cylindrosporum]|uniref:Uncharacterized protein n=1 Tax=Hebeloma cylindrosporum TaxID=76867 RepID=A0A0C2Y0N5_HEBCY|nr:hypothetical protein M413DRAFT_25800 [Hebeloma cylindrosporum h7]
MVMHVRAPRSPFVSLGISRAPRSLGRCTILQARPVPPTPHSYYDQVQPTETALSGKGSLKDALTTFAMERVSIRVLYNKYELLGGSKKALLATLQFFEDLEVACSRRLQQAPAAVDDDAAPVPTGSLTIPLALERGPEKGAQFLHSNGEAGEAFLFNSRPVFRVLAQGAKKIVEPVICITFFGAAVILTGLRLSDLVTVHCRDKGEGGAEKIAVEGAKVEGGGIDDEDAWITDDGSFGSENDIEDKGQAEQKNQVTGKGERKERPDDHDVSEKENSAAAVDVDEKVNAPGMTRIEKEGIANGRARSEGLRKKDIGPATEEAEANEQQLDSSNFDVERALAQLRAGDIGAANAEPLTPTWLVYAREQARAGLLGQDDFDDLTHARPPPSNLLPHFKALARAAQISARRKATTKMPNAKPGTPQKRRGRARKVPNKPLARSLRSPRASPLIVNKARFDLTPRRPQAHTRGSSNTPPSAPSARTARHRRKSGHASTFSQYYLQSIENST